MSGREGKEPIRHRIYDAGQYGHAADTLARLAAIKQSLGDDPHVARLRELIAEGKRLLEPLSVHPHASEQGLADPEGER